MNLGRCYIFRDFVARVLSFQEGVNYMSEIVGIV